MEVPWVYGVVSLTIACLYYIGTAYSILWVLSPRTRVFGIVSALTLLLAVQIHANIMHLIAFGTLYDRSILGLALAFALSATLLVIQYKALKKNNVDIFSDEIRKNYTTAVFLAILLIALLSSIDRLV